MDGVLNNQDLLKICFSYFDPDSFSNNIGTLGITARRRLISTALTCKAFYEPAMSLLWRRMGSIFPLLKILPEFIKMNETYAINGPIQPAHMERLLSYAKHIQHISLDRPQEDSIAGHTLLRLSHLSPTIFPALVTILVSIPSFISRNVDDLNCLFLVGSSPSLRTLMIIDMDRSTEGLVASFLAFVAGGKARLEDLWLNGRLSENSLGLLSGFGGLRKLYLKATNTAFPMSTIKDWAGLEVLEELVVVLDGSSSFTLDDPTHFHFQTLQTLNLTGPSDEIAFLLLSISSSTLLSLSIFISPSPTLSNDDSTSCANSICRCIEGCTLPSSRSLQHLKISSSKTPKSVTLPGDALLPLSTCSELRSFEFSCLTIHLVLTDVDIKRLCESGGWRHLESLTLPTSPRGRAPSLKGVYELVRGFPGLNTLRCAVDWSLCEAEKMGEWKDLPRTKNNLKDLTMLRVGPRIIGSQQVPEATSFSLAMFVSCFLEYHFPFLGATSNPNLGADADRPGSRMRYITDSIREKEWWEGVKRLVPEWRVVREKRDAIAEGVTVEGTEGMQAV